jgi:hypothetical protein
MTEEPAVSRAKPPELPAPPKKRRLRSIALGLVILICGGVLGSGITLVVVQRTMEVIQTPGEAPKRIAERMRRKLDLSPEQTSQVLAILKEREQGIRSTLREIEPKIEEELMKTREQVSGTLNPAQAKKWCKRFDYLHERWRSRWFGPSQEKERK